MKLVLKVVGGLLGVAVLSVLCLIAFLAFSATRPAHPVGVQQVLAADQGHSPIGVTIYYPTTQTPSLRWLGMSFAYLASNAAVTGRAHPLVVVSHGTGGAATSHLDTILALVEAGYVVAAPLHNGDNFQDASDVGTSEWLVNRARQIVRVNDFMLDQWKDSNRLDPKRLGLFGFSAGATTALVVIGGIPDLGRIEPLCKTRPEFVCQLQKPGPTMRIPVTTEWTHDPRVAAAVVVAPGYGFTFEPNGLSMVKARVQLWEGSADSKLPLATNADVVRRLLAEPPQFHLVDKADHFSFLAPCGAAALLLPRMLCTDPTGFDRIAFHALFNTEVVAFFNQSLRQLESMAAQQKVPGSFDHRAN